MIFKPLYDTNNNSITFSGLNSLANGSTVFSSALDNSSSLDLDNLIDALITAASSSVSATGTVSFIIAASADNGSTYPTNAADCELLAVRNLAANNATCKLGAKSVAALYGGTLPQKYKLGITNNSGAALASSGNSAWYAAVQAQGV